MISQKKEILFLTCMVFLVIISSNIISAEDCNLNVNLINQDPITANPGDYVRVVFQVSGVENQACQGARFSLMLNYPFSLDNAENQKTLSAGTYSSSDYSSTWNIPYTIRVDEGALDGNSELKVKYSPGNWDIGSSITKSFNISIKNSQTNFDSVIQEISGSDVSIALANIGKYTANSVVVRIPEQDYFTATSTDGQMVGNLESGDYTIVSFSLSSKGVSPTSQPSKNSRNSSLDFQPSLKSSPKELTFDVYYTDNIGERRVATMKLPLTLSSAVNTSSISKTGFPGRKSASSWSIWYTIGIILGVLILVGIILAKKYPKQAKEFLEKIKNKKKKASSNQIPEWVKNNKEKERK